VLAPTPGCFTLNPGAPRGHGKGTAPTHAVKSDLIWVTIVRLIGIVSN
jgi:hypothetical protein